jgi:tetratricopeptide (TPR) repeat protein
MKSFSPSGVQSNFPLADFAFSAYHTLEAVSLYRGITMTRHITRLGALVALLVLVSNSFAQDKSKEDLQKEALALNTIRSEDAIKKKIADLAEDKKYARQLVKAAAELLPKKDETTFTYSGAHILGTIASDLREYKTATEFLLIAIEKAVKIKSTKKLYWNRITLVENYLADHRPADAENILKKILDSAPPFNVEDEEDAQTIGTTRFLAGMDLARAQMQQGKFEASLKQIDKMYKKIEDGEYGPAAKPYIQRLHAQYHTYKGSLKDAIKIYEQIMENEETEKLKDSYQEVIGNLEADAGNVDKAYDILSALLKKKPDAPGLNNDLGYILASHDRKLDEAARMIKKAVEAEPENSSFLDSMAWVLYKQKKFKEAKEYMMKAVAQERGKNTELMEHLGDIHLALGERDDAKKAYQAALDAVTFNYKDQARKPELEKKLKELK